MSKNAFIIEHAPGQQNDQPGSHYEVVNAEGKVVHRCSSEQHAVHWAREQGLTPHLSKTRHSTNIHDTAHWTAV